MTSLVDLLKAAQNTYERLNRPDGVNDRVIDGYELVRYSFDRKTNHGGIAYYNESEKALLIAHRGSATRHDWLVTNIATTFGMEQSGADRAAIRFAEDVIAKLEMDGKEIKTVYESGHSKGGRESQTVLKKLTDEYDFDCFGVTFNSMGMFHPAHINEYQHINLRINGGYPMTSDIVSGIHEQLGANADVEVFGVSNSIQAHSLDSCELALDQYPELNSIRVPDFIDALNGGSSVEDLLTEPEDNFEVDIQLTNTVLTNEIAQIIGVSRLGQNSELLSLVDRFSQVSDKQDQSLRYIQDSLDNYQRNEKIDPALLNATLSYSEYGVLKDFAIESLFKKLGELGGIGEAEAITACREAMFQNDVAVADSWDSVMPSDLKVYKPVNYPEIDVSLQKPVHTKEVDRGNDHELLI